MRIMYLTFSFTVGGTERLTVDICNHLSREHDVFLYIINDKIDNQLIETIDNSVIVHCQNRKNKSIFYVFKTMLEIYKYAIENNIQVIHCNSINCPEMLVLTKLLRPKTRIIYTIHSVDGFGKMAKSRVLLRNLICTRIIAISECVKRKIILQGASKNKTIVIYNGINFNKFLKQKKQFDSNNPVIGCLGRIDPAIKGQDLLVKATKQLSETYPRIVCCCGGAVQSKEEMAKITQYIKENHLESNIVFMGNINNVSKFYSMIDVAVVPSRAEGFGLSFVEALSLGIPCVSSNVDGLTELNNILKQGVMFEKGSVEDLTEKILLVLMNYEEIKNAMNPNMVLSKFCIESMCEKLIEIYRDGILL